MLRVTRPGSVACDRTNCGLDVDALVRREERFPNVLLERFAKKDVGELQGVQFATWAEPESLATGDEAAIHVHAQNAFDTERVLTVQLTQRPDLGKRGQVDFGKDARLVLPPFAAGTLTIPVTFDPKAKGKYHVFFRADVEGRGGRRGRVFRGRPYRPPINPALRVASR